MGFDGFDLKTVFFAYDYEVDRTCCNADAGAFGEGIMSSLGESGLVTSCWFWSAENFGSLRMRTRLCFIFSSPFSFQVCSLIWLWIRSSTNFSQLRGPRRSWYTFWFVWLSFWVPIFAILLLRTVTIAFPGFFIVELLGLTFGICDPSASTSYNPSRFFFDMLFHCILRDSFTCTRRSNRVIGLHSAVRKQSWFEIRAVPLSVISASGCCCHHFLELDMATVEILPLIIGKDAFGCDGVCI